MARRNRSIIRKILELIQKEDIRIQHISKAGNRNLNVFIFPTFRMIVMSEYCSKSLQLQLKVLLNLNI